MKIVEKFYQRAESNPGKLAVITEKNRLGYADLRSLVEAFDRILADRGVRPGSTLAFAASRREFYLIAALLASKRGYRLILCDPDTVEAEGIPFDHALVTRRAETVPDDRQLVIDAGWFADIGTSRSPAIPATSGEGAELVFPSSGSTGKVKFIRCNETFLHRAWQVFDRDAAPLYSSLRIYSSVSPSLRWSLGAYLRTIVNGGSVLFLNDDAEGLLQYIDLYKVEALILTPVTVKAMLEVENPGQFLASVRRVQVGGAYVSPELLSDFAALGDFDILQGFGTSEIGGVALRRYDRDVPPPAGYIGEVVDPKYEIGFFDEDFTLLPGATSGVVGFRSPELIQNDAYLGETQFFETSGFRDGWFFPGDLMRREGDSLFLEGRIKNIVNLGGNKRSASVLAEGIEREFGLGLVSCVAVPDAYGLEKLHVFYQGGREVTLDEVNACLRAAFGSISAAGCARLAALPITDSGKIDEEKLRGLAKAGT